MPIWRLQVAATNFLLTTTGNLNWNSGVAFIQKEDRRWLFTPYAVRLSFLQYLLFIRCVVRTEERAAVYFVNLKLNREKQTLNPITKAKDIKEMKEKMSGIFFFFEFNFFESCSLCCAERASPWEKIDVDQSRDHCWERNSLRSWPFFFFLVFFSGPQIKS